MKSIFVLTAKCLVLSGLIVAGCTFAETIDFNLDFSGTRTVEFHNLTMSKDGIVFEQNDGEIITKFEYIDSIALWMDNVSNVKIDTSDAERPRISYDFTSAGPQIRDKEKYDYFMKKMPEEMQWYFKEQPNSVKVLNENQVLWNGVQRKMDELELKTRNEISTDHEGVSFATTLRFQRRIKDIAPKHEDMIISLDRKTIIADIDLEKLFDQKQPNEVIITFD